VLNTNAFMSQYMASGNNKRGASLKRFTEELAAKSPVIPASLNGSKDNYDSGNTQKSSTK